MYSRFSLASDSNGDFYENIGTSTNKATDQVFEWVMEKMFNMMVRNEKFENSPLLKGILQQYIPMLERHHVPTIDKKLPFKSCIPGAKLAVNIDGSISICEKCESLKIGHIENGVDIQRSTQLVNDWKNFIEDKCVNCWAALLCKNCYISGWDGVAFNLEKQFLFCETTKKQIEKWLEMYLPLKKIKPRFFEFIKEVDERFE
jgi:radical SAM protein with 4Fe4S-binding SPASM domain